MIEKKFFGKTDIGQDAYIYTLTAGKYSAQITDFGATITELWCPDKNGVNTDIVLGFDNLDGYLKPCGSFGATIGRFGNRIKDGEFILNGKTYKLAKNDGSNHLHGGAKGFDKRLFESQEDDGRLICKYLSVDGEEGYPGNLELTVAFSLNENGELSIEYSAVCDSDTVFNPTNHSYFNVNGEASGEGINNTYLTVNADCFCETDDKLLANGNLVPVAGTDIDFTKARLIGDILNSEYPAIKQCGGIDYNFALRKGSVAATLYSPLSGIRVDCSTDRPGIQIYTSNFPNTPTHGKSGFQYPKYYAACMETQGFPNSVLHKNFPSPILKKGERFISKTIYKMSNEIF